MLNEPCIEIEKVQYSFRISFECLIFINRWNIVNVVLQLLLVKKTNSEITYIVPTSFGVFQFQSDSSTLYTSILVESHGVTGVVVTRAAHFYVIIWTGYSANEFFVHYPEIRIPQV